MPPQPNPQNRSPRSENDPTDDPQRTDASSGIFAMLVDRAPFGIVAIDSEFRIAQISDGAMAAFRNVRPLIGRDFGEALRVIWPSEFAEDVIDIFRHTLETGEPYLASSLGEKRQDIDETESYEWQIHRDRLPDGKLGVVGHFIDRTETERQIAASEQRYRRLFESAQDGILILDLETMKIVEANPYISQLLGRPHEDVVGKELWEIGLLDDKERSREAASALRENGYTRYEDLPLVCHDGSIKHVEVICSVYDAGDERVAQCNVRDISQRFSMERQIKAQAEELVVISNRKDEFLAMLSHEIRNPMAAISSAVQLLDEGSTDDQRLKDKARQVIRRQLDHLSRLTDDLLEVSRITSGRISLQFASADLESIIDAAIERNQPAITRRQQSLHVDRSTQPIRLEADASRLEQVIGNLLGNASKYGQMGGSVWLTTRIDESEAVISVRDDGIGMSSETLPTIFDMFTQADKSLDRTDGGLGIGLALVERIVTSHGGTVKAYSAGLGKGSEITVRLPIAEQSGPQPSESNIHADEEPGLASDDDEQLRVLVVDDNVDAAQMIASLVEIWGFDVDLAYDGPTALATASSFDPHVILCDIGLPGMDGYQVASEIRNDPGLRTTRLVAITGYGQESDRQKAKDAGFDVHMVKPVKTAEIKALLDDLNDGD